MRRHLMRKTCTAVMIMVGAVVGVGARPMQDPQLEAVMRTKLAHAQKLLEAVVTSDWNSLETYSRELEQVTNDPRWTILKYPEFARYSLAFVRAVRALRTAATQRDLEKTPEAYARVTLACVGCHRYLARARIAHERGQSRDGARVSMAQRSRDQAGVSKCSVGRVPAREIPRPISVLRQETHGVVRALSHAAGDPEVAVAWQLAVAVAHLRERHVDGARNVAARKLVGLSHVDDQRITLAQR